MEETSGEGVKESEVVMLLSALAMEEPQKELKPEYKAGIGVVYDVSGISVPADKMRIAEEKGLLEPLGETSFAACPRCGSLILKILLKCPNCQSQSLIKSDIMVHYECGFSAPIEEFHQKEGRYVCPRCRKELKRVGIDYGRPGIGFKCQSCGQIFQYPMVVLSCNEDHEFRIDEAELKHYPSYRLSSQLKTMRRIYDLLSIARTRLRFKGVESELLAKVKGKSSMNHVIPLLVKTNPPIIIDFILDEKTFENYMLQTLVKLMDLDVKAIIVVKSFMENKIRSLINPERVRVIPITNEYDIPDLIVSEVLSIAET